MQERSREQKDTLSSNVAISLVEIEVQEKFARYIDPTSIKDVLPATPL